MSQSRNFDYVGRYKIALSKDGERWECTDRSTNKIEHTADKKRDAIDWAAMHSLKKRHDNA